MCFFSVNIDECEGVTCENGGRCQDGENQFTCECEAGFRGEFCQGALKLDIHYFRGCRFFFNDSLNLTTK